MIYVLLEASVIARVIGAGGRLETLKRLAEGDAKERGYGQLADWSLHADQGWRSAGPAQGAYYRIVETEVWRP